MQKIINSFLRPETLHSVNPPVINVSGVTVIRKDHSLYSSKQQQCRGVVLYCHSFGSNKYQSEAILPFVIKNKMKLVAFNFMKSDKQGKVNNQKGVVTFGHHEAQQIQSVLEWISENKLGPVVLWGRSMGAVAALKSQILKPTVNGLILDSPYQSLKQAIRFMISQHINVPSFLVDSAYLLFKPSIQDCLGFQIQNLNLGELLVQSQHLKIPCLFISSKTDTYFGEATESLYQKYPGMKQLVFTENSHGSARQEKVLETALKNLLNMVKVIEKRIIKVNLSISLKEKEKEKEKEKDKEQSYQVQMQGLHLVRKTRKPMRVIKLQHVGLNRKKLQFESIKQSKVIPHCFGFCSTFI